MRVKMWVLKEFESTGCDCVRSGSTDYGNGMGSGFVSVNSKCPKCHGLGVILSEVKEDK